MVSTLVVFAALPLLFVGGYLLLLTLLSGRPAIPAPTSQPVAFTFIVPAHNEAVGIARTVQSLLAVDYPAGRCLPGMPAPVTDGEAGGAIRHAPASVRVSAWSYQSSSFSSSCSASSGIFWATLMMVW